MPDTELHWNVYNLMGGDRILLRGTGCEVRVPDTLCKGCLTEDKSACKVPNWPKGLAGPMCSWHSRHGLEILWLLMCEQNPGGAPQLQSGLHGFKEIMERLRLDTPPSFAELQHQYAINADKRVYYDMVVSACQKQVGPNVHLLWQFVCAESACAKC